jgi:hypothetical protein
LPIVVSVALMTALAALYLGGILNPAGNLRHFPIAAVMSRGLTMCGIGLVLGLTLGAVVTRIYDRKGYHRLAAAPADTSGKA